MAAAKAQKLARRLLQIRDGGGTMWAMLPNYRRVLVARFILLMVFIGGCSQYEWGTNQSIVSVFGIGMTFGAILSSFNILRASAIGWGFTYRVIDWQEVEALARGETD